MARTEHRQPGYGVRLEWGPVGAELLAADCAAVVVVDVLSFCTAVDIAVGRGAQVLPQRWGDPAAAAREARERGAQPAGPRTGSGPSLRPSSLLGLAAGTRLALPSPNGATLCAVAGGAGAHVFAGCLRNASAVAGAAWAAAAGERTEPERPVLAGEQSRTTGRPSGSRHDRTAGQPPANTHNQTPGQPPAGAQGGIVGLVPAGERWPDGTLRVAAEDLIGAGAIAAALPAVHRSPEAELAVAVFTAARDRGLAAVLAALASGRELIADGFGADVALAADWNVSSTAPRLRAGLLT